MLDIDDVDLADLALALEDHSAEHRWLLDPASGVIEPRFGALDEAPADGALAVEPLPVAVGYGDMEDFVAYVRDVRARDLLERAIVGRGAFRRFKDALAAFPELRRAWFAFHDARGERRAIEWLAEQGLVDEATASAALVARTDPEPGDLPGLLDAEGLARRVAMDLRRVYRGRLRGVLLAGPWARGDAHPEAAVELVVVLESFADRWAERRRMERALWRHSVRNDAVVTALPVTAGELGAVRGADDDGARPVEGRIPPGTEDDNNATTRRLARAHDEAAAARVLLDAGFPAQAMACAYHAALAAAEATLIATGLTPATPAGIVSAFCHQLVTGADLAPDHARALRRLYEDHATIDHGLDDPPAAEATAALAAADAIREACEQRLAAASLRPVPTGS
ncbi:MAG TPA: UPF0158 family protein [Baekduia sp.]|nr:UPF0158 family protein [Baekduia sp.]